MELDPDFFEEVKSFCAALNGPVLANVDSAIRRLIQHVWPTVECVNCKVTAEKMDNMCQLFYNMQCDDKTETIFQELTSSMGLCLQQSPFILQFLLPEIVSLLLEKMKTKLSPVMMPGEPKKTELDKTEEAVLRYVAGYIVFKLKRHFSKSNSENAGKLKETLLSSVECPELELKQSTNFLMYTRAMVDLVNRGGLVKVTDNMYSFFHVMETVVKPVLQYDNLHKLAYCNTASILKKKLQDEVAVHTSWEVVCCDLENSLKMKLLAIVIDNYLKLRIKAFTTAYSFVQQRNNKIRNQKGTRKDLKQKKTQ